MLYAVSLSPAKNPSFHEHYTVAFPSVSGSQISNISVY